VRPGENGLATRAPAVVLGPLEAGLPGLDRPPGPAGETAGSRPDAAHAGNCSACGHARGTGRSPGPD
jgi:hypothetical protein